MCRTLLLMLLHVAILLLLVIECIVRIPIIALTFPSPCDTISPLDSVYTDGIVANFS
jgi:hypothetical protein